MDASNRIAHLKLELNRLNHEYYVLGRSSQSDADYDRLYQELVSLETQFPELVDSDSPTQRVGSLVKAPSTVRHGVRMLSLKNTYTPEEVLGFFASDKVVSIEPKIDGLSLKLIYRRGRLTQAITRGDGSEGEDATVSARVIKSIPLSLPRPDTIEVVGEVFMSVSVFDQLNKELQANGDEEFANPRNAAAGSFRLRDPKEVAARNLSFVAYGLNTDTGLKTMSDVRKYLQNQRFMTVWELPSVDDYLYGFGTRTLESASMVQEFITEAERAKANLDVATDGLVIKIHDLNRQRDLGHGTKYPNHSCAYKFPPERKPTVLRDITLQVGRTGKVTPVAELAPISLSGSKVQRASLCNGNEIQRLGITIGDHVLVEKSAEIIPKVVGLSQKISPGVYVMPSKCPCCDKPLHRPAGYVDVYCVNRQCPDQVLNRLKHACSKSALDIDGCGEATIRELIRNGVNCLSDLFSVKDCEFLKPAAREKFLAGREKAKSAPYWRKLHALGIEGLGSSLCQDVAARWDSLTEAILTIDWDTDEILARKKRGDDYRTLRDIIGNVNTEELCLWLEHNVDELERLHAIGFYLQRDAKGTGLLNGKVFCITGTLMSGQRSEIQDLILQAGGTVKGSVTKTVNYLVVGAEAGKTKTEAARKHGAHVITEEALFQMMGMPLPVAADETHDY